MPVTTVRDELGCSWALGITNPATCVIDTDPAGVTCAKAVLFRVCTHPMSVARRPFGPWATEVADHASPALLALARTRPANGAIITTIQFACSSYFVYEFLGAFCLTCGSNKYPNALAVTGAIGAIAACAMSVANLLPIEAWALTGAFRVPIAWNTIRTRTAAGPVSVGV